jgi:hypothetical protein
MLIIIEVAYLRVADILINELITEYKNKIKKVNKGAKTIEFINNDFIKFISSNSTRIDGLRADVAIGPHAEIFTCQSKISEKIWGGKELDNYLKNL